MKKCSSRPDMLSQQWSIYHFLYPMSVLNLKDPTAEHMHTMGQQILLELYWTTEERSARSVCIASLEQHRQDASSALPASDLQGPLLRAH